MNGGLAALQRFSVYVVKRGKRPVSLQRDMQVTYSATRWLPRSWTLPV